MISNDIAFAEHGGRSLRTVVAVTHPSTKPSIHNHTVMRAPAHGHHVREAELAGHKRIYDADRPLDKPQRRCSDGTTLQIIKYLT